MFRLVEIVFAMSTIWQAETNHADQINIHTCQTWKTNLYSWIIQWEQESILPSTLCAWGNSCNKNYSQLVTRAINATSKDINS